MPSEPVARGVVVTLATRHREPLAALAKEALAILRGLHAPGHASERVEDGADYALLLVDEGSELGAASVPDMAGRAASVVGVGEEAPEARAAIARARRSLRARGAALGARELLLRPADFGYLGLESDTQRERLEILLRALVVDAERLRLRREGWEEPDEA